ncbi:uncharacterized protein LOC129927136 [Biomphalaria glabrata]|uniref:Uncharacterized protein LOC129927136 n=1 Tax=Biomphalaria glabrata TaxID=6526 RepID=A0A9W3ASW9_BIOGL|nr:uncharacterized protein LOC129927136 [Biomphalaria glabrata]
MFNYQYQNLASFCRDLLLLELGHQSQIRMDRDRFQLIVTDLSRYMRESSFLRECRDIPLLYHALTSLQDCFLVSRRLDGRLEEEMGTWRSKEDIDHYVAVNNFWIPERDYSFFYGRQNSSLPPWRNVPDALKALVLDLCAIQNKNKRNHLIEHQKSRRMRLMNADLLIDDAPECDN